MKGSTAKSILRSLKGKRLEGFLRQFSEDANGELIVKICRFFHDTRSATETDVMAQFELTRGQYLHYMEKIGDKLDVMFSGNGGAFSSITHTVELAQLLISNGESASASDVIRVGILEAVDREEFDLAIRLWQKAEQLPEKPAIELAGQVTIFTLRKNLSAYEELYLAYTEATKETTAAARRERLNDLIQAPELTDLDRALSNRAVFLFHKLRFNCFIHLREYELARVEGEVFLRYVQQVPWIHDDPQYVEAHVFKNVAQLLQITGKLDQHQAIVSEFFARPYSSRAAILERDFYQFPATIGIAIQLGDRQKLQKAMQAFSKLYDSRSEEYSRLYLTDNLSVCLYGAFAAKDSEQMTQYTRILNRYKKSDFRPEYYCLYQFLLLGRAIEDREWEDAKRIVKNLRGGTTLNCFVGLRTAIDFVAEQISAFSQLSPNDRLILSQEARVKLSRIVESLDFQDYFDLEIWFESMGLGCPMLELLSSQASDSHFQPLQPLD